MALGDLDLVYCTGCGLVFNRAFRADLVPYGPGYENDQTASPSFSRHVDDRVRAIVEDGVRHREIIEIGCGNGNFLRRLCRTSGSRGLGLDPAARAAHFPDGGGVRLEAHPFMEPALERPADVVVVRHVIEHVDDPVGFLRRIRTVLRPSSHALLYLETPALEWILESSASWDLCYEHASYFSERALRNTLLLAGFAVLRVERVFGAQYFWLSAAPSPERRDPEPAIGDELERLEAFVARQALDLRQWTERIHALAARGPVAVWGAGAKGATFLHLADPDASRVAFVIDIHPQKQGRYLAATGHPVVSPESVSLRGLANVILLNPNYRDEVERRLAELGLPARLHVAE